MFVLGIESSCDETAAAVINDEGKLLSSVVWTQLEEHKKFGGVVPEIAARAHLEKLDEIVKKALSDAGIGFKDLSAIAVAGGPGLIGGVIVGVMTAKAIAAVLDIPFVAVNHLEGHALASFIDNSDLTFPFLLMLTSGGHCQILEALGVGKYKLLGKTIDDSAGEAFDKVAKMLNLGYPGGPYVEKAAAFGDKKRFDLPRPMKGKPNCDFSFSGLKTAVLRIRDNLGEGITLQDKQDLAASFQAAVADVMENRLERAADIFKNDCPNANYLVVAGGVAANQTIRQMIVKVAEKKGLKPAFPPLSLCTDNAGMIAYAGLQKLKAGMQSSLDFRPRPRWPLYE